MKVELRIERAVPWRPEEVEVVDSALGLPIPFEWTGPDTIAVDERVAAIAAVRFVSNRRRIF